MRKLESLLGYPRYELRRFTKIADDCYRPFHIRRPGTTKWRHIDNPIGGIRKIQEAIRATILDSIVFPASMLGSVKGKSIRDNATAHIGQPVVCKLDLNNCFPSIYDKMVFRAFNDVLQC